MNRKTWLILGVLSLFVGVVGAALYQEYVITQAGTVSNIEFSFTLDGDPFDPETEMINWETLTAGTPETCELTVTNEEIFTATIAFTVPDLPVGWEETWVPDKSTLLQGETATGILTIIPPPDAPNGMLVDWTFTIVATQFGE